MMMENEMNIRPYLEDLEARIDADEEIRLEQEWLRFVDGQCREEIFTPGRKKSEPTISWPHIMINDALKSYDLMILQQLALCSENLRKGNGELLSIRSNYGTGIIPTMLGAEIFYMPYETDTLPASRPFAGGKEKLFRVMAEYKPDYKKGFARNVFEMAERYQEMIQNYPKITRFLHCYNPDLQGPLALTEMTWGSDLYVSMYEDEEQVEEALDFFTDVYIDFTKKWKNYYPDFDKEHAVEWGLLHRGGTIIRNDAAMNISGDMYAEFVRPRDQRIIDEFGGCIHFCGTGQHYIEKVSEIRGISGINMSQPECNDMEIIYRNTVDKGLIIIGMPEKEVIRARGEGRRLKGHVHCGASLAAWEKAER